MRIVLLNDDGKEGIPDLVRVKKIIESDLRGGIEKHEIVGAVIPRSNTTGHGGFLRVGEDINVLPFHSKEIPNMYTIDGYSAECVYYASAAFEFDAFVSVNYGNNIGVDIFNSSTVMGIVQGFWLGYPGLAVSLSKSRFLDGQILLNVLDLVEETRKAYSLNFPEEPCDRISVNSRLGIVPRITETVMNPKYSTFKIVDHPSDDLPSAYTDAFALSKGRVVLTDLTHTFGGK